MSPESLQIITAAIISIFLGLVVYRLARTKKLSFRYAVGWLSICGLGLFAVVLIPLVKPISNQLRVSPAVFFGLTAAVIFVSICIQLSISISGMQEQIRRIAEEQAHLKIGLNGRLKELEQSRPDASEK